MSIKELQRLYGTTKQSKALLNTLGDDSIRTVFLRGMIGSATPLLFSSIVPKVNRTILFILQDTDEAGYFYNDLRQVIGDGSVLFFPSSYRRAVKYGQRDAANEILRTEVLTCVNANKPVCVVTSPDAMSELVVSRANLDERTLSLRVGQVADITELRHTLIDFGFQETDYVYEPGQLAVRGSILDVFSFSCEYPYRVDFFGDEIDTIRTFEVQDQLSKERKEEIDIVPELSGLANKKVSFLKSLPEETVLVARDFAYVRDSIGRIYDDGFSHQAMAEQLEEATEIEQERIKRDMRREVQLLTATQFAEDAETFKRVEYGNQMPTDTPQATIQFNISPQTLFHKNFELLRQTIDGYSSKGYNIYILADSSKQQQRLRDIFDAMSFEGSTSFDAPKNTTVQFETVDKTLHEGFVDNDLQACFFTDHQIFDRFHKYSLDSDTARRGKIALTMKELREMEPGDFIVHVDFGVGKFGGLVRVPVKNSYQEMIRIIYQNNDKVDVSIHSLYKISKYKRGDTGKPPHLSTLGTGAWERLKERTKKRIKDIARDLIKLYAKRKQEKGYSFSADGFMQHELEASFLYEDTPDQLKATQEVKADMEEGRPMDRLVCGDVGFGKTEIAVRAAFKAACDSKQVAVLVPTTVLALQHYHTFCDRLKDFPVRVDYLSRARSAKQVHAMLNDLEAGNIDILIGTHKLIGKDVKWKDLGLLIIDEEQKFGVSVKEKLRTLKTNVDTLTMSATPIPRTLQFSLMGARDMSVIRTPPPNRYPIQTEVATFDHETVADAINFEMSRNGQVYFVNDRISTLPEIAAMMKRHVPDCRVAIGHGQMKPEELERVILGFVNYDYDVLLSTTIVENGIDIPNANTIIINDAHHFGLSDLHQMRGRVGRSNRKAFCYLLAPPKSVLTPEARRRLDALENFSELGSGFNLAMQDLDIRGAGNLLGGEQSGFIEDLGYETYQKILTQAVRELKTNEFNDLYAADIAQGKDFNGDDFVDDCVIESDLEMYFPDDYVPGDRERMALYRELDDINDDTGLSTYRMRLIDRFGPIPKEAEELMCVVPLRRLGKQLGCEKIILRQGRMSMQFVGNAESVYYKSNVFDKVLNYIVSNPRRCNLNEVRGRRLMRVDHVESVEMAVVILKEIV